MRTDMEDEMDGNILHISDLPVDILVDVSSYLAKPSAAILAVALNASSSLQNVDLMYNSSDISTAIIAEHQWDILDLEDIDKELTNKLTDYDIFAILACINSQDVLKRLKLAGCINIKGHGLNPLRNSPVLEQIDISLVGTYGRNKWDHDRFKISFETVVPILDSIFSTEGCSLKYVMFPERWRGQLVGSYTLTGLFKRFNERKVQSIISNQKINCDKSNICSIQWNKDAHRIWKKNNLLFGFA